MQAPDITPAQVLSLITFILTLLVSNLWINSGTAKLVTDMAAIIVPAAWMVADSIIRHGRAHAHAVIEAAKITANATTR